MRTHLVLAALCTGLPLAMLQATAADAQGRPQPEPRFPLKMTITPAPNPAPELPLRMAPYAPDRSTPPKGAPVYLGPFRAQMSGTGNSAYISHYSLDGVDVLGGSVIGTVDRGRPQLYLRWPTDRD